MVFSWILSGHRLQILLFLRLLRGGLLRFFPLGLARRFRGPLGQQGGVPQQ